MKKFNKFAFVDLENAELIQVWKVVGRDGIRKHSVSLPTELVESRVEGTLKFKTSR